MSGGGGFDPLVPGRGTVDTHGEAERVRYRQYESL